MTQLRSRLESHLAQRYTIERELQAGGMARVFVATEHALGRRVVIKVLSPEVAAEVSSRRFEREIRLAASLQQANIVPVLSAGETDGVPHYTMPFVEGLSLRERLERGRPDLVETIGILRDVARALAYAHERGVVHRDIKPENILLSGDAAVVTDFGIAKAIASARVTTGGAPSVTADITGIGVAVGTPRYMAPEQFAMDPDIDHRADLYAFGCLAYELIAGEPPFAHDSFQALLTAHIADDPQPLTQRRPDTPTELGTLVMRCLEKDAGRRPQSAREVLRLLEGSATRPARLTRFVNRLSRGQRRALLTSGVIVFAALLGLAARAFLRAPNPITVAVIPFLNVGGDSANEYLADGVADGLATALGRVRGVRVVARSSSYRYKGRRDVDVREIGRALSANHVLHGTLQRVGNALRVSAQLFDARSNLELWSSSYERRSADALAVQDEIARQIAGELARRFGSTANTSAASLTAGTSNADAYDLYLRGRFLLQRRGAGVREAAIKFQEAIAKDSNFARAHASLALALELLPYFARVRTDSLGALAIPAARRALALDSTLAEAHTALGLALSHAYRWREAEAEHRRAVAGAAEYDSHLQFGRFLFYTGRFAEAQRQFERARQLEPYSAAASGWVGHLLDLSGRSSQAIIELRRALEIDSTNPPSLLMMAQALSHVGRRSEALSYLERLWRSVPSWHVSAAAELARQGDERRALELIKDFSTPPLPAQSNLMKALLYSGLGDSSAYFDAIERATAAGEPWPTFFSLSERHFDYMRRSARFERIVRGVGLDPRVLTSSTGGRPQ